MPEIIGYVGTEPEACKNQDGEDYFAFRLAENHGELGSRNRKENWYRVRAKVPQAVGAKLCVGQKVRIRGRLEIQAFIKRRFVSSEKIPEKWIEVDQLLKEKKALGVSVVLLTAAVELCEPSTDIKGASKPAAA